MKHANIAFFVTHEGCPHLCTFCNQRSISGKSSSPSLEEIRETVKSQCEKMDENRRKNTEIAFFGGSFTAINYGKMEDYLKTAKELTDKYSLKGIRASTRPDALSDNVIEALKKYGVTSIELGVQSTSDRVLSMNKRGHTRADVFEGARKIKSAGIELGLQMMPGLYGDTRETILKTAEDIVAIAPKTVRIYPTVVVKNTELEKLYENGEFTPLSLDEAVEICSQLLLKFEEKGIHVIKMGLHSETSLELDVVAGPYHPSFKELCLSGIYLKRILEKIGDEKEGRIYVCPRELSQAKGQKGTNLKRLSEKGKNIEILPDEALSAGEIIFEKGRNVK